MQRPKLFRRKPIDKIGGQRIAQQEVSEVRERRSISQALKDAFGPELFDKVRSPSTQMAVALNHKHGPTYAGTVSKAVIVRRRAANKRARHARALHRSRR